MVEESVFYPQKTDTQKIETDNMRIKSSVEATLGFSEKWDAREAGREVAESAIQNLTEPPNFFLLFSTIHYEKYGGFKNFLDGVWDVLPKGTPLIGGTVAGFMNNYGVYAQGATALAVSCPDMDVAIGYGKNTKRNPKEAVMHSVNMIKNDLKSSPHNNRFLFNFVSGTSVMQIPGQGNKKVVDSGFMSKFVMLAFGMSQYLFQKGFGREDEIFEEIIKKLPKYYMLLGASMDDYKAIKNYQFFNNNIFTNSVVNIGISTDLNFDVCTTHGMTETDKKFEITKLSRNKHIIHKINNKPAVAELLRLLDWPEGFLTEKTMMHRILYYPISLRRHGRDVPAVMAGILKESIITPCALDDGEVTVLTVSGKNLIQAMSKNLDFFKEMQPEFGLFSTCITIFETLGYKTNILRDELLRYFNEKPFLMFFSPGEGTYSPAKNITYANMSFNTVIFGHNQNMVM
ncbi:MAG: hypothetical protein NT038_10775 [Euryarchaeota archaeon]|nr:hypothetical protein [Euryarchaeota archaeon]